MKQRLTQQLSDKGVKNAPQLAKNLLIKQGNMSPSGTLTPKGRKRSKMSNAERAIDREVRSKGKGVYGYNVKTNKAFKINPI